MSRRVACVLAASLCWLLLCIRWFDAAAGWRPRAIEVLPPWLLLVGVGAGIAGAPWREPAPSTTRDRWSLALALALAFCFRLPFVIQGAAGAVTPDGALSGIVALHARDGVERLVFVPHVP